MLGEKWKDEGKFWKLNNLYPPKNPLFVQNYFDSKNVYFLCYYHVIWANKYDSLT